MTTSPVSLRRDGEIATITFNRPEQLNPLSVEFQQALLTTLTQLQDDETVRAVVLTGSGRGFCVGADLTAMDDGQEDPRSLGERVYQGMHDLSNRIVLTIHNFPVPVVAALNGAVAGAGVGLALSPDVVVAARSAYFYLPFLPRLGIVPDLGSTWFLERVLGRARATGLALLDERLSAEQACAWGLIWSCVDDQDLHAEAVRLARRLARAPIHAIQEARMAFDAASSHSLREQLAYEAVRQRDLLDRPAFKEGLQAFRERREPNFTKPKSSG